MDAARLIQSGLAILALVAAVYARTRDEQAADALMLLAAWLAPSPATLRGALRR